MTSIIKKLTVLVLAIAMTMSIGISALAASVTSRQATDRALRDAGLKKSKIMALEVEYDAEDGEYEVEFRRHSDKSEYEYTISAGSGKILEASVDFKHKVNRSRHKIGKQAAQKKAAKYAGCKAAVVKRGSCRYKKDGREWIYEIRFKNGNYNHEVEVLAPTGKIVDAEKKLRR